MPDVVRRRGQSFSFLVAKLVIPAGLCSPRQAYRLQPSHQHTHWSSCEAELLLLYQDRAVPGITDWWWPLVAWFQRSEASLKHELLPTHAVKPSVFMEEDQVIEIMQNLAQQFVTTTKKLTSKKIPSYRLHFSFTLYFKCNCVFNVN